MNKEQNFVTNELHKSAELFIERNEDYGDSYKRHGEVLSILFPDGIVLKTVSDYNRFSILNAIIGKLNRYAANYTDKGHNDSLRDISVFAIMQMELDND